MSQSDLSIQNNTFAGVRGDLNENLQAIATRNSGPNNPSFTYPYMHGLSTTAGRDRIRNPADDGWINGLDFSQAGFGITPQNTAKRHVFRFTGDNVATTFTAALPTNCTRLEYTIRVSNLGAEGGGGSSLFVGTVSTQPPVATAGQFLLFDHSSRSAGSFGPPADPAVQKQLSLYGHNDRFDTLSGFGSIVKMPNNRLIVQRNNFRIVREPGGYLAQGVLAEVWSPPYAHNFGPLKFFSYQGIGNPAQPMPLPLTFQMDIYADAIA